jgi:hypothetical protein
VLGGYDANRMVRNSVIFPFHDDVERVHTVWIERMSLQRHGSTLEDGQLIGSNQPVRDIQSHLESNRPFIYLPPEVCDQISNMLGLDYNKKLDFYLVSNQTYTRLTNTIQPNLTFSITPITRSNNPVPPVNITLPYTSLILKLDYPFADYSKPTWYVPIRAATNPKQYVLGRTFLQNAYLVSDYERQSFSIHEAKLEAPVGPVPLLRNISAQNLNVSTLDSWRINTRDSRLGKETSLSKLAIVGIAIGSIVTVLLVTLLFSCLWRRRRAKAMEIRGDGDSDRVYEVSEKSAAHELAIEKPPQLHEADSSAVYEIPDSATRTTGMTNSGSTLTEMPDASISEPFEMPDSSTTSAQSSGSSNDTSKSSHQGSNNIPSSRNNRRATETINEDGRLAVKQHVERPPATPIQQTPHEYYDRSAHPFHRFRERNDGKKI